VNAFNYLRANNIKNINCDLMFGMPNTSLNNVKNDIEYVLSFNPTHISYYSLIIEEHTKLYLDIKNKKIDEPDDDLEADMYSYINQVLKDNGYNHYEVSNFAKSTFQSEHNITYWNNDEYYGFGLSSHGYINNMRYENTRNFTKYLEGKYRFNEFLISTREDMENEVILGLRKLEGISITKFKSKYNKNIYDVFKIKEAIDKNYLCLKDDYIYIPENKIYVMNEIINMII
jgi:oxygen-independent coproporphyrinogen-3 oxidase